MARPIVHSMNTKTRLALMLGLLLLAFGATLWSLRVWHARQNDRMLATLQSERQALLGKVMQLTSSPLRNFATDYSNWDEMVAFVGTADPAWAAVNLDASLQTFNLHGVWVLRTDGTPVYGATRQLDEAQRTLPVPTAALLEIMRQKKFIGFFVDTPEGLLEIRTAPIQPSSDIRRETIAQGWLLVGQLWNPAYVETLGKVLDSEVRLLPPGTTNLPASTPPGIRLQHDLKNWEDLPVRTLLLDHRPQSLLTPLQDKQSDLAIFGIFGIAMIVVTIIGISRWVIRPLRQFEQSMVDGSPAALRELADKTDEFGRLARLATSSFVHTAALEREVEERKRAESALRLSEEQVRGSAELRSRLARDLHDNIIQSIYATGLGLESVLRTLRTEPAVAEQHLEAVRKTLNQLIREIRSFITGLEPENSGPTPQFAQALRTLAGTLQSLHPIKIEVDLNITAAARLSAHEEVHALQIVREGVSNALRHGGATRIDLRLLDRDGITVLQIEDNGSGFDPAAAAGLGSGLGNQTARAREMGATLRLDSAPGDGTRLTLRFDRTPTA